MTVADDGPGIPAEQQDRLFDASQRRDRRSLGIGLTICRKIVDAHGGHIWVESTPPARAPPLPSLSSTLAHPWLPRHELITSERPSTIR